MIKKAKREKKRFYVYTISFNKWVIYVGLTDNIRRRETQHNYLYKGGKVKDLYDYLRLQNFTERIELKPIKVLDTRVEAKRYECMLILQDHFSNKLLKQKVPNIMDR
jgi:predicted GIY-YIG superfamily endonuclease